MLEMTCYTYFYPLLGISNMNAALLTAKHDQGNIINQTYNYTRKC